MGPRSAELPIGDAGTWAADKHAYLSKYIHATWGVRRKRKKGVAAPGYVDLFSGPGLTRVEDTGEVIDGSPLVAWKAAAEHEAPFAAMYLFDTHRDYAEAAEARLKELGAPAKGLRGTALEGAKHAAARLDADSYHLVFADPYNLRDLPWSIFEMLTPLRHVDFIAHFSSSDLARNLERYFQDDSPILEDFAPGWKATVGSTMRDPVQMRGLFFRHWIGLFEREGFKLADAVPLITNTKGAPLYRLVCLSRHPLASKIWGSLETRTQGNLFG